ncbi:MAG: CHRD domain-containing protein [Gemmatimonadaceae bacterium]
MRTTLAVCSLLLISAAACSGDYGRSTSPYTTPPGPPYPKDTTVTVPPPAPARAIVSLVIAAPESILVAGDSTQLSVIGLDAQGQQVATVRTPTYSVDNGFSFLVSADGFLTALYSSFRPFRANVRASTVIDGVFLTTTRRFDVTSAAPARFDFLTSMLPEGIRPEPLFTAADGIVYLTFTNTGIDFTILWSNLAGNPVGAHLHGPADTDEVAGILADFPIGDQSENHGLVRGTLTSASIRARDGRPAISLDSLKALIRKRAVYADVHSVGFPEGEIRGSPFAVPDSSAAPVTLRGSAAGAALRTSRSPR